MFCLYCGTNLPDDAVFCDKCGKPQKATAEASAPSTSIQMKSSFPDGVRSSGQLTAGNMPMVEGTSAEDAVPAVQGNTPAPGSPPAEQELYSHAVSLDSAASQQRTSYDPLPPPPQKSKRPLLIGIGGALTAIIIIIGIIIAAAASRTPTTFTTPNTGTTIPVATTAPTILSAPVQISPASGTVFNNYPRTTTLEWNAVPGALSYTVQIYFYQPSDTTCTNGALWGTEPGINGTSYTFNFVGAQPGCWQVRAVDATGQQGTQSPLWEFSYTQ